MPRQKQKVLDWFSRIVEWNNERGLIVRGFDHAREVSYIIEELLESTGKFSSQSGRDLAKRLAAKLVKLGTAKPEQMVDALGDIIVFAAGAIAKLGYDPSKVMEEVYREINSRKGRLVDGKFVTDTSVPTYTADFSTCKL